MKNKVLMSIIVICLAIGLSACGKQEAAPAAGPPGGYASNQAGGGSMNHGSMEMGDEPAGSDPVMDTPQNDAQSSGSNSSETNGETAGGTAPAGSADKPSEPVKETPPPQPESSGGGSDAADKQTEGQDKNVQQDQNEQQNQNEQPEAEEYTVEIKDFDYAVDELTVSAGATITFINKDKAAHTATVDGEFDSGYLKQDESFTVTLSKAGEYAVYCIPHPFMKMTIKVE
jgi:plastocyanin